MIYEIAESVKKTVENNCDAYEIYIDESKTIELDSLKEELNFAKEEIDLVVADVMMPVMDGLKMCEELKKDSRTSHIPIILLTARQMVIQMKEGLELGADDYITKPFNMQSLILKVGNIIASREKLKVLYGQTIAVENLGLEINSDVSDEKFLQQLNAHIDQYISEPDLNADSLCRTVGMSRATLYRKVVAATGLSPARYIQTVRLNMAARMLENSDMSVTDIAIATGFSSIVHFSSSFRKKYGIIENVSDKEFFTNSIHVPVWKKMSPFEKIDIEAELTGYSNAGCITYVELDSGAQNNLEALEQLVNYAMDKDIPYFAINVPSDTCLECGYTDEFNEACPICGSDNIQQLRRVTGYLTGDYKTAFNKGKQQEADMRYKHSKQLKGWSNEN